MPSLTTVWEYMRVMEWRRVVPSSDLEQHGGSADSGAHRICVWTSCERGWGNQEEPAGFAVTQMETLSVKNHFYYCILGHTIQSSLLVRHF